jgi:hypothetical protein
MLARVSIDEVAVGCPDAELIVLPCRGFGESSFTHTVLPFASTLFEICARTGFEHTSSVAVANADTTSE